MLSISNPMKGVDAAVQYYLDQRKEDYYLNGVDKKGLWFGRGAERMNLGQEVERAVFRRLLNGFAPDGMQPLVQNAGQANRQACWDMTFNAPKSVSVLWAMSEPDTRQHIELAHQAAVQTALRVAEEVAGITRRGPGGKIQEQADLVWAIFQEGTSRAQDPHLHTHAVLCNLGLRQDGTTGSIATSNLFRWKMALGAVYQAEFARRLGQSHDLTIQPDRSAFRIREVPDQLCRFLSQRRQSIEAAMTERGEEGAIAAKTAAKDTRPGKEDVPPERLFPRWHAIGEAHGWGPEHARRLVGRAQDRAMTPQELDKLAREAIQAIPPARQNRSFLIRQVSRVALEHGADGSTLFVSLARVRLPSGQRALWQPGWPGQTNARPASEHGRQAEQTLGQAVTSHPQAGQEATAAQARRQAKDRKRPGKKAKSRAKQQQRAKPGRRGAGPNQGHSGWDQRMETPDEPGPGRPRGESMAAEEEQGGPSRHLFWKFHLRWKALYDKKPWVPEKGKFFHVHWVQPFENGWWSVARNIQIPSVGVELPCLGLGPGKKFVPRWSSILWKKPFGFFELRLQLRTLNRRAPAWSPFRQMSVPALRFKLRRAESKPMRPSPKRSKPHQSESRSQDHGHSH